MALPAYALATVVLLAVFAPSPATAEPVAAKNRRLRLLAIGSGVTVYALSEALFKEPLTVDLCRWCAGNFIDDAARNATVWSDPNAAASLSDYTGYLMVPLGIPVLLGLASSGFEGDRALRILDDLIPVAEAATYSALLAQGAKMLFGRSRPFVRFRDPEVPAEIDDNVSFFSGHTTLAVSIAVAAGAVAHRRGYALEPVIWGAGLALSTATGYLRMGADRHYLSDVLTGAGIGTLAGLLIPRLTGSLPAHVTLMPTGNGIALGGRF